jgi:hypothetical protein
VAKPVIETSVREETYTVQKPVYETQFRDNSYTRIKYIQETGEREEVYTVNKPVYETGEREETYTVMKPVYETSSRVENYTVMRPVTTCQTRYVDQGFMAQQTVMKPSWPATRLHWSGGGTAVDPATGLAVYQRPGLYWEQTPRGTYEVQNVWQPNVVPQQVQTTNYVPQVESRAVPVTTVRYQPETVVRKVPVQTCRIEQQQIVKKVPITVMKPVEERVEVKTPVKVCRWISETQVRKIPITTTRMTYEERVEQQPYKVLKQVAVEETVRTPRVVEKRIPVTYTYKVPHVVCYRVPLDACGNPIVETVVPSTTTKPADDLSPTPDPKNDAPSSYGKKTPTLASPKKADKGDDLNPPSLGDKEDLTSEILKGTDEKDNSHLEDQSTDPSTKKRPVVPVPPEKKNTEPSAGLNLGDPNHRT